MFAEDLVVTNLVIVKEIEDHVLISVTNTETSKLVYVILDKEESSTAWTLTGIGNYRSNLACMGECCRDRCQIPVTEGLKGWLSENPNEVILSRKSHGRFKDSGRSLRFSPREDPRLFEGANIIIGRRPL